MPDPRKTINPETGRPIGEDRVSPFDRRLPPDEVDGAALSRGTDEVPVTLEPGLSKDRVGNNARFVIIDVNAEEDPAQAMIKALFDED